MFFLFVGSMLTGAVAQKFFGSTPGREKPSASKPAPSQSVVRTAARKKVISPEKTGQASSGPHDFLTEASGASLQLAMKKLTPNEQAISAVASRFATHYPEKMTGTHASVTEKEIAARLIILRALGKMPRLPESALSLLKNIALSKKEVLLVKREALRAFAKHRRSANESEKLRTLASLGTDVISISGLDDRELVEALLEK